jgi:stage V sporulation protein G
MSRPTLTSGYTEDPYGRHGAGELSTSRSDFPAYDSTPEPERRPSRERPGTRSPVGSEHHEHYEADERHVHHSGIAITDVQIRLVDNDRLRAWATLTFNDAFVIKGIRIIQGNRRLFVAMPSKQQKDGKYQDIAHPINPDFRDFIEECILDVHRRAAPDNPARPGRSSSDTDFDDF